jgi:hypothetical protein
MKYCFGMIALSVVAFAQTPVAPALSPPAEPDPIKTLVDRLDLEKYKAPLKARRSLATGDRVRTATALPSTGLRLS